MPISIDSGIANQTELLLGNFSLPRNYDPFYIRMYGHTLEDKINMFACDNLRNMHLYLHTHEAEHLYWVPSLEHFTQVGILEKLV